MSAETKIAQILAGGHKAQTFSQFIRLLVRKCACPEFFDVAAKITVWEGSSHCLPPPVRRGRAV